jgi:hypothetical protein
VAPEHKRLTMLHDIEQYRRSLEAAPVGGLGGECIDEGAGGAESGGGGPAAGTRAAAEAYQERGGHFYTALTLVREQAVRAAMEPDSPVAIADLEDEYKAVYMQRCRHELERLGKQVPPPSTSRRCLHHLPLTVPLAARSSTSAAAWRSATTSSCSASATG